MMLGIQLEEKSVLIGDNMSVAVNFTLPSPALRRNIKHKIMIAFMKQLQLVISNLVT